VAKVLEPFIKIFFICQYNNYIFAKQVHIGLPLAQNGINIYQTAGLWASY